MSDSYQLNFNAFILFALFPIGLCCCAYIRWTLQLYVAISLPFLLSYLCFHLYFKLLCMFKFFGLWLFVF